MVGEERVECIKNFYSYVTTSPENINYMYIKFNICRAKTLWWGRRGWSVSRIT